MLPLKLLRGTLGAADRFDRSERCCCLLFLLPPPLPVPVVLPLPLAPLPVPLLFVLGAMDDGTKVRVLGAV